MMYLLRCATIRGSPDKERNRVAGESARIPQCFLGNQVAEQIRQNLVYILGDAELSKELRSKVQGWLSSVQDELVVLTGGISLN